MFARVSRATFQPGTEEENARVWRELHAELRRRPGFQAGYLLHNAATKEALAISIWDREADIASSDAVRQPHVAKLRANIDASIPTSVGISEVRGRVERSLQGQP